MKKLKKLTWVAYCLLVLMASCSEDNENDSKPMYTVTVTALENGTVTADPTSCEAGETVILTATPNEGFIFVKWTVKSGEVILADATANPVEFTMPKGNIALEASFAEKIIPYAIRVTSGGNGSVKALVGEAETTEAAEGTPVVLTATPDEGYEFVSWNITGLELSEEELAKNPLTITMPADEISAAASFKEKINVLDLITDPTFKAYAKYCMSNGDGKREVNGTTLEQPLWDIDLDGMLSEKEAAAVKFIDLNRFYNETAGDKGIEVDMISSLAGIEYFTGIKSLDIADNLFDTSDLEVDLTNCKKLVEVTAEDSGYGLAKVILGEKNELKILNLGTCWDLADVDLGNCPNLEELTIGCDYIEEINLAPLTKLKKLDLNLAIESIDLSANTELTALYLSGGLTTLDISRQTKLTTLNCSGNKLSVVDISKMAFNADGTYTAFVGNQKSGWATLLNLEKLIMRADQKKHWDEVLTVGSNNQALNSRILAIEVVD
ncbi:InlB B-repeat-containing protein [Bacteroides congonensis]|uniref:InlB B-repeat-containing protein n=1 Tax=Bacteroides congonensis TaxID=1871006 RepID=UPI003A88855D